MKLLGLFICWMFGHEPTSDRIVFEIFDDVISLGTCKRCDCLISYELGRGWVKW